MMFNRQHTKHNLTLISNVPRSSAKNFHFMATASIKLACLSYNRWQNVLLWGQMMLSLLTSNSLSAGYCLSTVVQELATIISELLISAPLSDRPSVHVSFSRTHWYISLSALVLRWVTDHVYSRASSSKLSWSRCLQKCINPLTL